MLAILIAKIIFIEMFQLPQIHWIRYTHMAVDRRILLLLFTLVPQTDRACLLINNFYEITISLFYLMTFARETGHCIYIWFSYIHTYFVVVIIIIQRQCSIKMANDKT